MNTEISKAYNPAEWEDKLYALWQESGFFNPDNLPGERKEVFSVLMPPPNVTGVLHLGHAMENALMDTMARYQRMQGKKVLYLPGVDHAAVATQSKVERSLIEQGIKNPRQELGREELLKRIRAFAEESKSTIVEQIKAMGSSADWSRFAYTFDEDRSLAVNTIFKKMFDEGLIYRGYRVVNWSPSGQSTLSDDEIVYREEKTILYTFRYGKDFPIPVSTTRPETKLGDTAVAVHPDDKRYKKFIGQTFTAEVGARSPLTVKIIADESIDPQFGTGAVGVTPAHSMADFEMYEKNPEIGIKVVIGTDGRMTEEAGENYQGLTISEGRERFVSWLRENNLLEKEEEITHNVGTSDRFGDIIELLPLRQWFVSVTKPMASRNGKSLKDLMRGNVNQEEEKNPEKVTIVPSRFSKVYFHWIDNLRDWCISRQIWWGHRIPVWYRGEEVYCGVDQPKGEGWKQDPDTLDTWFSSGTWTFSTLGWPEEANDLKKYHPISWMQMGKDILFFWMARMILMTTYALNTIPFKEVYIHGMLRDKEGKKFSKSLGTGVDPMAVSSEYGTDALRLALLSDISPGNDSRFSKEKMEASRNFVNKLWNIGRYVRSNAGENTNPETLADDWILWKFDLALRDVDQSMKKNNFSLAVNALQEFTWNDFADWYVEIHKVNKNSVLLENVFERLLRAWHPFVPFVSEALFQQSEESASPLLMTEHYPKVGGKEYTLMPAMRFAQVIELIQRIRSLRALYRIEPKKALRLFLATPDTVFQENSNIIEKLARLEKIDFVSAKETGAHIVGENYSALIQLEGIIDIAKEKHRLGEEKENLEKYRKNIAGRLTDKNFTAQAPKTIVDQNKQSLTETEKKIEEITKALAALGS